MIPAPLFCEAQNNIQFLAAYRQAVLVNTGSPIIERKGLKRIFDLRPEPLDQFDFSPPTPFAKFLEGDFSDRLTKSAHIGLAVDNREIL